MTFHLVSVGCIECNGGGDMSAPLVEGSYATFTEANEALEAWLAEGYHSDSDRFIIDGETGRITTPPRSAY